MQETCRTLTSGLLANSAAQVVRVCLLGCLKFPQILSVWYPVQSILTHVLRSVKTKFPKLR